MFHTTILTLQKLLKCDRVYNYVMSDGWVKSMSEKEKEDFRNEAIHTYRN
ncbi:hypothetical protein [Candidatus Endomicrobiellum trichonymphae]|nr:hypothetical protein [Candidatus Endomicrobium trichonymphae]